ncbi:MAG: histidine triad nucleotide-binding protein [Dethiosulfovibrio peptidovorans]|nr:MAG: histidine triad nucleotide-binding protein [Dethiosulfovibrio peptidovorans]
MSSGCPFCKIVSGELPASVLYENDRCIAFQDLAPQAPSHILIVPREHIPSVNHVEDLDLWVALMGAVQKVVSQISPDSGYRLVVNCGDDGGQTVPHLHVHLLSGRPMGWPPG